MAIFRGSPEARIHRGTLAAADDTVDYTDSTSALHVDMSGTPARSGLRPISGGYAEGDRFFSIEFVWGSAFNDNLVGAGLANGLFGHHGNEIDIRALGVTRTALETALRNQATGTATTKTAPAPARDRLGVSCSTCWPRRAC